MADTFTTESIRNTLFDLFGKFKHGDVQISESSHITADLGIDSLSVMEIVAELEDTYDLTFPDEDLPSVRTVGDVIGVIERGLKACGRLSS
jgi:acyl carrier protein